MSHLNCILSPYKIPGAEDIILPDGEEVIIGRLRVYKITNVGCSRQQLSIIADYKSQTVVLSVLGLRSSFVADREIPRGGISTAKQGDIIELIKGGPKFCVSFTEKLKRSGDSLEKIGQKKMKGDLIWENRVNDQVLFASSPDFEDDRKKIASFDLDGTLIKTKSGYKFPTGINDWQMWDASVKPTLTKLYEEGWKIVVFTNQAALSTPKGKLLINEFKEKIHNIMKYLEVPVNVYISVIDGYYRKPAPGMWEMMRTTTFSHGRDFDMKESFYCGDAAGRPAKWKPGRQGDFAISDRLFALNIGVKFYTPEEFFFKENPNPYNDIKFDPRATDVRSEKFQFKPSRDQEVIVMTGSPASGKSHFVKCYLLPEGYVPVSRDKLGTWQKCVALLKKFLSEGKKVVVDNTNPDAASRQRYIEVCKDLNVTARCFFMETTLDRCLHNNKYRRIVDAKHDIVNPPIIKNFHSHFQHPKLEEGFSEIVGVPFFPIFEDEELKKMYFYHLLSK